MGYKNDFERLNARFENRLATARRSVLDTDLTPEKRAERRARCDGDPLAFASTYYPNLFNLEFNDLHKWTAGIGPGKYSQDGFRYSGKTAIAYVKMIIMPLCLGAQGVVNLNANNYDISCAIAAGITRIMMGNRMLVYDYDLKLTRDAAGYKIINGTPFVCGSFRTGLRSVHDDDLKRITWQLNDDLYGTDEAASPTMCEKIYNFVVDEAWGQLDQINAYTSLTLGNVINESCPIWKLKEAYPDNHFSFPALDSQGRSNWEAFRTAKEWEAFSRTIPYDIWMSQYMCLPVMRGENFKEEYFRFVNINTETIVASVTACDPAHGTSPEACDKGLATLSVTAKGEVIGRDIYLRKEDYLLMFDYVDSLRGRIEKWKALLFENDFGQWNLAELYYRDWMRKHGKTLPIIEYHSRASKTEHRAADKDSRILTLVHPHQTGQLVYDERIKNSPEFVKYKRQALSHGKAKQKLDGLDAMATAYIMIFRWVTQGSFEPTKNRAFAAGLKRIFGGGGFNG